MNRLVLALFWAAALLLAGAPSASGQCGACANVSFGPAGRSFSVPGGIFSAISADFNGDGIPDLAFMGFNQSVTILLGNGVGAFTMSATVPLGPNSNSMTAGDVNGDGKIDLVVARGSYNSDPGGLTVFLGDGAGGVQSQSEAAAPVYPSGAVIADVNGDGRPDLVIGSLMSSSFYLLAGDGIGGFGPPPPAPQPPFSGPSKVRVADFDGDGLLDVAVVYGSTLKISLGSGGGQFLPARTIALAPLSDVQTFVTADLNRDGLPDLVVADYQYTAIFMGVGGGDFEPPVIRQQFPIAAIGDFNEDGIPDFISRSQVFFGDGFGGVVAGLPVRIFGGSVLAVDVDSDGRNDLVVWSYPTSRVDVLRGVGNGRFESAPETPTGGDYPAHIVAGDFNGDGRLDVAVAGQSSGFAVLLNNGDGTFGPAIISPVYVQTMAAVDFNGDGKIDIVGVGQSFSQAVLVIYPGDGTGHLGSGTSFSLPGSSAGSLVVADINHDQKPDVIAVVDGRIVVLLNDGLGGFSSEQVFGTPFGTASLAVGDVNGDGHPDIVAQQGTKIQTYLGDGLGGFAQGPASVVSNSGYSLLLKDINEDGKLDLFSYGDFSILTWLRGDGSGGFGAPVVIAGYPNGYLGIAVADFNGDGHPELAALTGGLVNFYRYDSVQGFQPIGAFATPGPGGLAADFSGDGKPDLVGFNNGSPGTIWYLENTNCKPRRLGFSRNVSSCNVAGSPLTVQPVARLTDDGDNLVGCNAGSVTAALSAGTGTPGAHLSGATTVPVAAGLAAFSDLSVDLPGRGYRLRLTHPQAGAVNSRTFSQSLPAPSIVQPTDLCTGGIDRFEGATGYDTYTWTLDGNVVGRSRILTLSGLAPGTHTLRLSVVQDGCSSSASVSLVPKSSPAAPAVSSNSPVPFAGTLQLAATNVPGAAYEWTGPNGFFSSDRNPSVPNVTPAASGTYRVVARANGCASSSAATVVKVLPAPLCSGCANPSFGAAARVFPMGSSVLRTAVRDFDGDGNLDVLVANVGDFYKTQVTFFPGDGRGGFTTGPVTQIDFVSRVFLVADINRDGVQDLVLADYSGSGVLVVPGLGDGRFGPPKSFVTGGDILDAVVGDFNEDGWPDVAVVSSYDRRLSVLLGDGAGGFLPPVRYLSGSFPTTLVIGDFNGDHHQDLAVALWSATAPSIAVLFGNGSGGFASGPGLALSQYAGILVPGDLDADGVTDLAVGTQLGSSGSSLFQGLSLFKGLGNGAFQFVRAIPTDPASSLRIRDINGDGKDDLVFLAASVKVLTGRGGFLFDPPQTFLAGLYSADLDIGDVDRDGRLDAVVAADGLLTLLHGVSNGVFGRSPVVPVGGGSIGAMLTADFNRDGHPDLAVADAGTGKISIFFGDGAGGLTLSSVLQDAQRLRAMASADFNGDGFPDFVATGEYSYGVAVYLNNGAGGFSGQNYVTSAGPMSVAIADFNGDGKLDLALNSAYTNAVSILVGDGAGHFAFPNDIHGFFLPIGVVAGDFNGDGKQDLAVINSNPPSLSIALGNGAGGFGTPGQIPLPSTPSFIAAGDFNRDGKLDVAVAHDRVSIFLGDGLGGFGAPTLVGPSGGIASVAVGDWNGDGKPDLSVTRQNSSVFVLVGDGTGGFASSAGYFTGTSSSVMTSADFDGDGRPDLAIAGFSSGDVSFLFNSNCVPSRLGVTANPSCAPAGQTFGTPPVVKVFDDGQNVVACGGGAVMAAIAPGTGTVGAVLGGTTSVSATNGVATFSNLSINLAGAGYQLDFRHPVASPARGAPFSVGNAPSPPVASNNGPICAGQTLSLSASAVAGALYRWTGPNGFVSPQQNPSIPNVGALASGTYRVTVIVNGCASPPATTSVTVISTATPVASNNGPICAGDTLQLSASSIPGATYRWTGPSAFVSTEQNPQILSCPLSAAGTYFVTATANGCASSSATTFASVLTRPSAVISAPSSTCPNSSGNSASVPSAGGGATYSWTIGNGTITSGAGTSAITFRAGLSGSVELGVTVRIGSCSATGSKSVTITAGSSCGNRFFAVTPCRVADTRDAAGPSGGPSLIAGATRSFPVAGICGIPASATAVAINVAVYEPSEDGDLRVYPAGGTPPDASSINFRAGIVRSNNAIILLDSTGQLAVQCDMHSGETHFFFDVYGYFQ